MRSVRCEGWSYGTRQKECDKCAVQHCLVRHIVRRAFPSVCAALSESVPSCKAPQIRIAALFL